MYATPDEYKTLKGDNCELSKLTFAMKMAQWILDSILTNQEQRTLTKTMSYSDMHKWQFRSAVFNIQSIEEVNWQTYTWVENDNYKVNGWKNNAIFINDLGDYDSYDVPYIDIKYLAWYSPVPFDLKDAHIEMTDLVLSKKAWAPMKSYKLWPRTVTFADSETVLNTIWSIESILYAYMQM